MSCHDGGALLTEFYQLTAHHAPGLFRPGHGGHGGLRFEFFVRRLPTGRNFLIAAGLEQALDYLEGLRFTPEELDWLARCRRFQPRFVDTEAAASVRELARQVDGGRQ